MEILSTGEKIKRARIYRGITLKELCGNKISISKMSCIENGKVKADEEILRYVSDVIELDYEYIAKDVYDQIIENIDIFEKGETSNLSLESDIKLNLDYAIGYKYYELAFKLIHKLFNYYLLNNKKDEILDIIPKYYDLYRRNNYDENNIIYFNDMAEYFYKIKEYSEAKTYYIRVIETLEKNKENQEKEIYCYSIYREGMCFLKCNQYDEAEKYLKRAKELSINIKNKEIISKVYYANNIIAILNNNLNLLDIEKSSELLDDITKIVSFKIDYAEAYFLINKEDEAIRQINEAISLLPQNFTYEIGEIYIKFANILKDNGKLEFAEELVDKALNIAIEINDIILIEKAYYLKGILLQRQNRFREAELYMNLSLDSLVKFGTKSDLYKRYIDIANMYHKTQEIQDSIKYFTLAMNIKSKI